MWGVPTLNPEAAIFSMDEKEVIKWNEFARELRRRSRWDLDKIEHSLARAMEALPGLERKEREDLLKIGWVVAERSSKLAVSFLRIGPPILSSLSPAIRPALIRWAMVLAHHSRETLIDFLERSRGILVILTEEESSFLLSQGLELAGLDPSISCRGKGDVAQNEERGT